MGRWIYFEGEAPRGGWYPYGYLVDSVDGRWAARPEPFTSDGNWRAPGRGLLLRRRTPVRRAAESDGRGAGVVFGSISRRARRARCT